jgi:outer membrane scaffolding protein for murein synthesis (MipA/OmpV family)
VRWLVFLFILSTALAEEPRPLLELGLAGGSGVAPDYPGSDQTHVHHIGFPVFYYHGKIFRSDRDDGARARVVNKPILAVDVSGSGAFPISSSENRAREGMRSLDWLGELGPRVYVRLMDQRGQLWRAYALVRGATTLGYGFRTTGRGLVMGTGVSFEHKNLWTENLSFHFKITPEFTSQEYQDYFYSVSDEDATSWRPAYHAKAGYLGTWTSAGVAYEWSTFAVFLGSSMIYLKGAANTSSPLFRDDLNFAVYFGLSWFFYHSDDPGYF